MTTIAGLTITRSSFQEPDCYDHFSQSLRNTDLCRPSLAVERNFLAVCPDHGGVWVAKSGHHISSKDAIGYEADSEWQQIAFAIRNLGRQF